jgi:hypothetical protein
MDTEQVRQCAHDHGQAVVRGDMDGVFSDFDPDVLAEFQAAGPPPELPSEVSHAEVKNVADEGDHAVASIAYTDASNGNVVTVHSKWEQRGDRPYITGLVGIDS